MCWMNSARLLLFYYIREKVHSRVCKNCHGSLSSFVGKLYAKVLINRVKQVTDDKIWDVQADFREGMSLMDQVYLLGVHNRKASGKAQESLLCFCRLGEGL